jgi:micrococcal nuclease
MFSMVQPLMPCLPSTKRAWAGLLLALLGLGVGVAAPAQPQTQTQTQTPPKVREFSDKPKAAAAANRAPDLSPGSKAWLALHGEPAQALADAAGQTEGDATSGTSARFQRGEYTGLVTQVTDGDTVWVALPAGSKPVRLRLEGIDAPEICQAGGAEAKAALAERVLNRAITVKLRAIDSYGRRIGKMFDETEDIGARMVKNGHAWSLRFRSDRGPYIVEERLARSLNRGLHASGTAIQPREFRQQHGSCKTDSVKR